MENIISILVVVGTISIVSIFFITIGAIVESYKRVKAKRNNRKNIIDNMEKVIKEWEK